MCIKNPFAVIGTKIIEKSFLNICSKIGEDFFFKSEERHKGNAAEKKNR